MLAMLWLIVWVTFADAFYDDYTWYTSDDGVNSQRTFDSQKVVRGNLSESLRSFADSYKSYNPARQGDEELTMAKVKSRLRMLKVFKHTGNPKDYDPKKGASLPLPEGARYCTMGRHTKVDCNHCTCVAGQLYMCTGMMCAKPVARPQEPGACVEGRKRQVDACNYCYCRNGHEICSTKDCRLKHDSLLRTPYTCHEGVRRQEDCNRCYCLNGEEYCTFKLCRKQKNFPHPSKIKTPTVPVINTSLKDHEMPEILGGRCSHGQVIEIDCRVCKCKHNHWRCSKQIYCVSPKTPEKDWETCREGSARQMDSCNTCYCHRGQEFCEMKDCNVDEELHLYRFLRSNFKRCVEGSYYRIDPCNYCLCLNGTEMCTRKPCLELESLSVLPCKEGSARQIDPCNYCSCKDGVYVCTNNICKKRFSNSFMKTEECHDWDVKYIKCNRCECHAKRWNCTQHLCDDNRGGKEPQQTSGGLKSNINLPLQSSLYSECDVGSIQLIDDCNYCRCIYRRKWKCTENVCPSDSNHRNILRKRVKELCTDGLRRTVNACNYCVCHSGVEFCTQKSCLNIRTASMIFSEPECLEGEPVPAPDACNLCICLNSDILCTNNSCIQEQQFNKRSSDRCVEGSKFKLKDGCNFCICQDGRPFCTSRACLVPENVREPIGSCKEREVRPAKDKCNICVCMNKKMVCTNKVCAKPRTALIRHGVESCTTRGCYDDKPLYDAKNCVEGELTPIGDHCNICVCMKNKWHCTIKLDCLRRRLGDADTHLTYIRMPNIKKHRMMKGSNQKCIPGKMYYPDDFDPNCPNDCICDRHELLCTKRKCFNNWDKNTPFNWPLGRVEPSKRNPRLQIEKPCEDYEPLPSDDVCNSCMCLSGRKVCTVVSCSDDIDDGSDGSLMNLIKESNGLKAKKKREFCEPFTFFSPDHNRFCRNCFCLYNGLALCLLNLCKYSKDIPHQNSPEELDEICTPGEIGYPTKCVTCTCSETSKWICTREELALCQERDCDVKDEFHMGFAPYCAGCKCSVKEWFCSIQSESCKDYSNVICPQGTFIHNPEQHCSICLCGGEAEGSNNLCFTEAKCVRQVSIQNKQ